MFFYILFGDIPNNIMCITIYYDFNKNHIEIIDLKTCYCSGFFIIFKCILLDNNEIKSSKYAFQKICIRCPVIEYTKHLLNIMLILFHAQRINVHKYGIKSMLCINYNESSINMIIQTTSI